MSLERDCFKLYIGCKTNQGQLIGMCENFLCIKSETSDMRIFKTEALGNNVFLFLRSMNDLSREEISSLIEKGINIGRPKGYSFSVDAFLFLLGLNVDLFGLINSGYAKHFTQQC